VGFATNGIIWKPVKVTNEFGQELAAPAIEASLTNRYLTVPVDFKAMLPLNSGGFCITAGPRVSLLLKSEYSNISENFFKNQRTLFSPLSFGLGGSFGGEIRLRKLDLLMNLCVDSDLGDSFESKDIALSRFTVKAEAGLRWAIKP